MNQSKTMQRPAFRSVVPRGRYFFAALSFLMMRASLVASIGLGGWLFFNFEAAPKLLVYGLGVSLALLILSGLNVVSNGRKVTCPLCRASFFMSTRNLVKPGVPKIITCAKTPLAFSLLTIPSAINCPYCAERVRLVRSPK